MMVRWKMSSGENSEPLIANIQFNTDEIREIVSIGVRRASAFVRLGLDGLEDRGKNDFNLSAGVNYQFWPRDLSDDHRGSVRDEFRSWLVGSCLRELDLFYSLFLDRVWEAIELSEHIGTSVRSDYVFGKSFLAKTNVGEKHREVARKLEIADEYEALNSLSLARNALAHHAGIVRAPRDCNNASRNALQAQWLALEPFVTRGGVERVLNGDIIHTNELPGEGPSKICARVVLRSQTFVAGEKIVFTAAQLAELCLFYILLRNNVIASLTAFIKSKGVLILPPQGQASLSLHTEGDIQDPDSERLAT